MEEDNLSIIGESYSKRIPKKEKVNYTKIIWGVGILLGSLILFFGSFYIINAGERGILLTFGKVDISAKGEGLHFKLPIIQKIVKMDVKTLKYEADLTAASRDLQDVNTKIAINYHITSESAPEIYRNIGINYADKIIYPYEQETNKAITSQFTAEELITKRDAVRERMKTELKDKLQSRGIIIEEISIVNFAFSPSFAQAIEAKVTAEQNALAAKNKLEQVKYEAEQTVTKGKAEAEALSLQKLQITPDLVQLRQIEVQREAIAKWNGIMPTTLLSGGNNILPTIPLNQGSQL
jgi:regulator of protease activity HflC (stomatin/prohibitin superfamily)